MISTKSQRGITGGPMFHPIRGKHPINDPATQEALINNLACNLLVLFEVEVDHTIAMYLSKLTANK